MAKKRDWFRQLWATGQAINFIVKIGNGPVAIWIVSMFSTVEPIYLATSCFLAAAAGWFIWERITVLLHSLTIDKFARIFCRRWFDEMKASTQYLDDESELLAFKLQAKINNEKRTITIRRGHNSPYISMSTSAKLNESQFVRWNALEQEGQERIVADLAVETSRIKQESSLVKSDEDSNLYILISETFPVRNLDRTYFFNALMSVESGMNLMTAKARLLLGK
jgi:hypothetical protein